MTNSKTIFIFGAGFSGKAYGALAAQKGAKVFGTTRSQEKAEQLENIGIVPLVFDGQTAFPQLEAAIAETTDLIVSIAPDEDGDPVLRAMGEHIGQTQHLKWIAYLSTVGVYGNHDGAWVDEMSECRPVSQRSVQRVAAENEWIEFCEQREMPLSILRLSGIYGPGRNALKNMVEGKARRLIKLGQVFNRIHVTDIAGSLALLSDKRANGIFNVTDDMPCPPQDVVEHAAHVTNLEPPEPLDFETATLSPMARSFYGENKRVSNARIKQMGFKFTYPDYRTALDDMWARNDWA